MISDSQHSSNFIRELALLVEQFANRGLIVRSLRADYGCFGSWVLEAYRNHETT